jgi:hypothetical protein
MTKGQQMMTEAKAYASEFYDSESADLKTSEKIAETIADFCAGWKAADKHHKHHKRHQWVPVEKRLPKEKQKVLAYFSPNEECGHEYACMALYNYGFHHWEDAEDSGIILEGVTHWKEIVSPGKEE